jgi:hypothetical protein
LTIALSALHYRKQADVRHGHVARIVEPCHEGVDPTVGCLASPPSIFVIHTAPRLILHVFGCRRVTHHNSTLGSLVEQYGIPSSATSSVTFR